MIFLHKRWRLIVGFLTIISVSCNQSSRQFQNASTDSSVDIQRQTSRPLSMFTVPRNVHIELNNATESVRGFLDPATGLLRPHRGATKVWVYLEFSPEERAKDIANIGALTTDSSLVKVSLVEDRGWFGTYKIFAITLDTAIDTIAQRAPTGDAGIDIYVGDSVDKSLKVTTIPVSIEASSYPVGNIRQFGTSGHEARNNNVDQSFIKTDLSGNVYIFSVTDGSFPGEKNDSGYDLYLRKYNPGGNLIWTRQLGSKDDSYFAYGIAISGHYEQSCRSAGSSVSIDSAIPRSDSIYTVHSVSSALSSTVETFLSCFDPNGRQVWEKKIERDGPFIYRITTPRVAVNSFGDAYVSAITEPHGLNKIFMAKYSVDGKKLWEKIYSSLERYENVGDMAINTADDSLYLAGTALGPIYDYLIKFDSLGNRLWERKLNTAAAPPTVSSDPQITLDSFGSVYISNRKRDGSGKAYLHKYKSTGDHEWVQEFSSMGISNSIRVEDITTDSSDLIYVAGRVVGSFEDQKPAGKSDSFIRIYTSAGVMSSVRQFGSPEDDGINGITSKNNTIHITGWTNGAFPGQSSLGNIDAFAGFDIFKDFGLK